MKTLYKIHKERLLLNPANGKPFKSMLSIRLSLNKMHCNKVNGKYVVMQSDIDKWNKACRVVNGL